MILTIDFGNSRVKVGVFHQQQMVYHAAFDKFTLAEVKKIFNLFADIEKCIISNVVDVSAAIDKFISSKATLIYLNSTTLLPIKNKYKTPATLGKDRLAVSCGAFNILGKQNILVINCGTCITYDFINSKKEYLGGSISLGLEMRCKALNYFTQKLPLIKIKNIDYLIGNDTESSIIAGVVNGTVAEIKGVIKNYKKKYLSLQVVITGGDAEFLAKHFKNCIFAPHLTLIGLHSIINHS
ncbi:MAG: hypothetical protein RL065_2002 [Bacteroidota bacterium]